MTERALSHCRECGSIASMHVHVAKLPTLDAVFK